MENKIPQAHEMVKATLYKLQLYQRYLEFQKYQLQFLCTLCRIRKTYLKKLYETIKVLCKQTIMSRIKNDGGIAIANL